MAIDAQQAFAAQVTEQRRTRHTTVPHVIAGKAISKGRSCSGRTLVIQT